MGINADEGSGNAAGFRRDSMRWGVAETEAAYDGIYIVFVLPQICILCCKNKCSYYILYSLKKKIYISVEHWSNLPPAFLKWHAYSIKERIRPVYVVSIGKKERKTK